MPVRRADPLRIRAADWNDTMRAARRVNQTSPPRGGSSPILLATTPTTAIARNTSEDLIPRYGAVVCMGPIIDPEDNESEWAMRLAIDCKIPDTNDQLAWVGIATTAIGAGKIGRICVSGAVPAIVDVSDADHQFATVEDEEEFLQSAASGPIRIVWKKSGTGAKKAIVMLASGGVSTTRKLFGLEGATLISGRSFQWDYDGVESTLDADGLPETVSGGLEVTLRNLAEVTNGTGFGAGIEPANLPSAIEIQAVGSTKDGWVGAVVEAVQREDGRWWFDRINVPDGPCG